MPETSSGASMQWLFEPRFGRWCQEIRRHEAVALKVLQGLLDGFSFDVVESCVSWKFQFGLFS
tara:strand:+ start:109873 stop:110061 length:189 start_codon:yes stop_codon:yes gene_type:complete